MLPPGPRQPDSPFFVSRDKTRPLLYCQALPDLRTFLRNGGCDHPDEYGLHGIRSEAFITCTGAVSEEAAVIQGGWSTITTASRYDRLTLPVAKSIASKMVNFHLVSPSTEPASTSNSPEALRSAGDSGIVAARRAARTAGGGRPTGTARVHQPITLPSGWKRVWHPTSGRQGGYATFEGPNGLTARSLKGAIDLSSSNVAPRAAAPALHPPGAQPVGPAATDILENLTVYDDRPSTRPPPSNRSRV